MTKKRRRHTPEQIIRKLEEGHVTPHQHLRLAQTRRQVTAHRRWSAAMPTSHIRGFARSMSPSGTDRPAEWLVHPSSGSRPGVGP